MLPSYVTLPILILCLFSFAYQILCFFVWVLEVSGVHIFPVTVMYTFGFGLSSVHALRVQQGYTSLINKLHVVLALLTPPRRQTQYVFFPESGHEGFFREKRCHLRLSSYTAGCSAEVMAVFEDCHQTLPKVLLK